MRSMKVYSWCVRLLSFSLVLFSARSVEGCATGEASNAGRKIHPADASVGLSDAEAPVDAFALDGSTDRSLESSLVESETSADEVAGSIEGDAMTPSEDASKEASTGGSGVELCNGLDDNGNGKIDEIFECILDSRDGPGCTTMCGAAGQRVCDGWSCSWGSCGAFPENCDNTIDDDCNGLVDCEDPVCESTANCRRSLDAGAAEASVEASTSPSGGACVSDGADATSVTWVTLSYVGPLEPGIVSVQAWWQPRCSATRAWAEIPECVDAIPSDGRLDCTFAVSSGSSPLEFQVYLPDGRYWGDTSMDPTGGGGANIGSVTLYANGSALPYSMTPNNPSGNPYFNGHVPSVP